MHSLSRLTHSPSKRTVRLTRSRIPGRMSTASRSSFKDSTPTSLTFRQRTKPWVQTLPRRSSANSQALGAVSRLCGERQDHPLVRKELEVGVDLPPPAGRSVRTRRGWLGRDVGGRRTSSVVRERRAGTQRRRGSRRLKCQPKPLWAAVGPLESCAAALGNIGS